MTVVDPGLSAERTSLARQRTALSVVVAAAVVVRVTAHRLDWRSTLALVAVLPLLAVLLRGRRAPAVAFAALSFGVAGTTLVALAWAWER